jgi:hypothetical protein
VSDTCTFFPLWIQTRLHTLRCGPDRFTFSGGIPTYVEERRMFHSRGMSGDILRYQCGMPSFVAFLNGIRFAKSLTGNNFVSVLIFFAYFCWNATTAVVSFALYSHGIDSFFVCFVHRPTFYKQITTFRQLDLLPSLGKEYLLRLICWRGLLPITGHLKTGAIPSPET